MLDSMRAGVGLGIAYHLGVDATLDGEGTYRGLPPMPQEGHQAIAGVNAIGEASALRSLDPNGEHALEPKYYDTLESARAYAKAHPFSILKRDGARNWVVYPRKTRKN